MKKIILLSCILILLPISVSAGTINVPGDQATIQAGIDAAVDGDIVLVADGTYSGTGNYNIEFKGKALTVKSVYGPEDCIIDCQQLGRGFVYLNTRLQQPSIIEGFTIRNGLSKGGNGGGIYCEVSSPEIKRCIFVNNEAGSGGGVYIEDLYISNKITDCKFENNTAAWKGGGLSVGYDSLSSVITGCTFYGNSAGSGGGVYSHSFAAFTGCVFDSNDARYSGGGVCTDASDTTSFLNCSFKNNFTSKSGGALYVWKSTVTNCSFVNNIARGSHCDGGGIYSNSSTIINCLFQGNFASESGGGLCGNDSEITNCSLNDNQANKGAGLYLYQDSDVINCTFCNNEAMEMGGAIYLNTRDLVKNCIIWENFAPVSSELYSFPHDNPYHVNVISNSNIKGGYNGEGNINVDPLFVDQKNHDFHLTSGSPCVDSGTADGAPATDLDDKPRPVGSGYDMGAYECQDVVVKLPPVISSFTATPTSGLPPLYITLSCVANDPDGGSIVEYQWDFNNDGTVDKFSVAATVTHIYSVSGVFEACCTVVDDDGATSKSNAVDITITDSPYTEGDYNYYLPYYSSADNDWTGLGLANLEHKESTQLSVKVYDSNGNLLAIENKNIKAYGQKAFPIATHLNQHGWMWVNSHQPLSGLAFIGTGTTPPLMADIPFMSELSSSLIIPHIAQNDVWDTTILLCNPNNENVSITLKYIDNDGVEQASQDFSLDKSGSGEYPLSTVFSEQIPLEGRIEIVSSTGVVAFALYTDKKSGGNYYAGINADSCE